MKLIDYEPKRLFTFGCSFTNYFWPTWAEIIALDLNIPLYNYGLCGAGNYHMFNMLMQADNYFNIDENDLVIIEWTNIMREDRWFDGRWQTPGNIFSQSVYSKEFVDTYANETFSSLRDFACIKAAYEFLKYKKCQSHFLKMMNFEDICQWGTTQGSPNEKIYLQYEKYLKLINPSFYEVLWQNDIQTKLKRNNSIHFNFLDGHPTIMEHFEYLRSIFIDHKFSENTINTVKIKNEEFITLAIEQASNREIGDQITPYKFDIEIKKSEPIIYI